MKLATVDIAALHGSTENASYAKAAGELFAALSEIGFAVIVNHGVDQKTIDEMCKAVAAVFATPREILMRDMVVKGNYRGFECRCRYVARCSARKASRPRESDHQARSRCAISRLRIDRRCPCPNSA
ncbi:MAG: 2-oxoglutarate and iron-dependent oxygenase domain-containing protein [Actinomycetota bacterium]